MYKEHIAFLTPSDNVITWRYLNLIKLVDILSRRKLYFPTADRLGDPFEGSYPKKWVTFFNEHLDEIFRPETWELVERKSAPKSFSRARKNKRKFTAISCWNKQEEESAALWQIYANTIGGIALQSTVGRLKKSIEKEQRDIYIGEVEYIDHFTEIPSSQLMGDLMLKVFLYKGKSYQFENEVRMVMSLPVLQKVDDYHVKPISKHKGWDVDIDPNILIEKVYVSPTSDKWQKKAVESLLYEFGLNKPVHQSDLKRSPIF